MAGSIVLKTFKGGNVTPQNDAIIYQTVIPGAGIFKGCEVTCARGNILHISQGFGMIKGRFFEVYENEVSVQLAETGKTLNGRLYIHMDLSNADEPIRIMAETGETLADLTTDQNVNYNNSSYDMELAAFRVDSSAVLDLTQTFSAVQAGGGSGSGGAGIQRDVAYAIGDTGTVQGAPGWCTLVCTQAGVTAAAEPSGYGQITKSGDKVLDGSCIFTARDIFGELDAADETADSLEQLKSDVDKIKNDTGALVFKLMSLAEYAALESYDDNTIYYCYTDGETRQITAIYLGENPIYATGITVNYHIDTGNVVTKKASMSNDALKDAPKAALDGYSFVGWRDDDRPQKDVLDSRIIGSEDTVDIYAVFTKKITIGMLDNGATLIEGKKTEELTDTLYYNNGNGESVGVKIPECPYEWEGKSFCGWNTDSYSDPSYFPGSIGKFEDEGYLFPMFIDTVYDFPYTGTYVPFTIPADGIYEFELYGGAGADVSATVNEEPLEAKGGKGGHVKAYKKMKKGSQIYLYNGGQGKSTTGGNNGGGYGYNYSSSGAVKHYGGGGGGATHVALYSGTLGTSISSSSTSFKSLDYAHKENIFLVAGGGGGAGITNTSSSSSGTSVGAHNGGDGGGDRGGDGSDGALGGRQISTGSTESSQFGRGEEYGGSGCTYSGGGGGWFGGHYGRYGASGAGGSGYVGGMPSFTHDKVYYRAVNEAGVNEGDGYSFIRYVKCIKVDE